MREATYGVSARVIASFFVLSIALVFFVSGNFGSFKFFTGSKSEFKVPIVELQTKLTSASDEFQARSTTTNSFRNRTVIREKNGGLEHGLARARALIRTAAALSPNMSLTLSDGDGDVLTSDIYRNYGEFYHLKVKKPSTQLKSDLNVKKLVERQLLICQNTYQQERKERWLVMSAHRGSTRGRMPRISSVDAMENWANQHKEKKLYIVLISLHGLISGENMELGRDSDTGGQVKYVVELARALGEMPGVYRVDLLMRQVSAPDVDWSCGEPTEMLNSRNSENDIHETGDSSGAYIIRIPFGPKEKYIPKELLWPHISEFVDGALCRIIQMSRVLGEQIGGMEPVWPAIHGHYADAGDSAALLSGALNVPMLFTGRSLGRDKLEQLLKQGRQSRDEINAAYKIMRRIEAEELSLDASEVVITSTRQEIEEQWRLYDGFDPILEHKLRATIKRNRNCYGRSMPRMVVMPPGMEFNHIVPQDADMVGETEGNEDNPPIWSEIMRFFSNAHKPMILALARPDPKKNITTLVKAFGECKPLRELANLTLTMGNRDAIDEMSNTNATVLLSILKLIDKYDLYGHVAYPKHHKQSDVPDIYHLAAKTKVLVCLMGGRIVKYSGLCGRKRGHRL